MSQEANKLLLPPDYEPSEQENYMSELQLLYFQNRLQKNKDDAFCL